MTSPTCNLRALPHATMDRGRSPVSRGPSDPATRPRRAPTALALLTSFALISCGGASGEEDGSNAAPPGPPPEANAPDEGGAEVQGGGATDSQEPAPYPLPVELEGLPDDFVPIFEDPKFEDNENVMTAYVGTPRPSKSAIEIDPMALMPADLPLTPEARAEVTAMMRAFQPLDLSLTSDHHDRQFILNKMRMEALERDERKEVGWAALHAFTNYPGEHIHVRKALLQVGARVSPDEAKPLLKKLCFTYGPRLSDRAEALGFLAEIAPEEYMEGARPYLERPGKPFQTAPPDDFFARAWVKACEVKGDSPVPMMSKVAMNLVLEPAARAYALETLGRHGDDPLARATLAEALVESTGDGYFRRKAAQGVLSAYTREDACSLLREVLSKESDVNMARFLDDMVQVNCR